MIYENGIRKGNWKRIFCYLRNAHRIEGDIDGEGRAICRTCGCYYYVFSL